jgi:geranylgeranyl diphosphate synthase type I
MLDLLDSSDRDAMHDLKTGSYTVRGPLALGHAVAGGGADGWAALRAFAAPLGIAFQLRDDLIGTFGDAKETGKPAGGDLRAGKHTAPIAVALERLDAAGRAELLGLLGSAAPEALPRARALVERVDGREVVEARIAELRGKALAALESPVLRPDGRGLLAALARAITDRRK